MVLEKFKEEEFKLRKEKIQKTSMVQDHSDAYLYDARFDNDFNTDYYFDEF